MKYISNYSIENILNYYETSINNRHNIHDDNYIKIKDQMIKDMKSNIKEVNEIICKRKGLYYELKYPLLDIVNLDDDNYIQSLINEYITHVDSLLEEQKGNSIANRDQIIFFLGYMVSLKGSLDFSEGAVITTIKQSKDEKIIDEIIQSIYYEVFNQRSD